MRASGARRCRWARAARSWRVAPSAAGPAMPPPGQTPLPDWDGLKLRVRTLIASHRVMIFSKSYCPYCNKVRRRREPPGSAPPASSLLRNRGSGSCFPPHASLARSGREVARRPGSVRGEGGPARPPCEATDICPQGGPGGKCGRGGGLESER